MSTLTPARPQDKVLLAAGYLTVYDAVDVANRGYMVELSPDTETRVESGRAVVERMLQSGRLVYGLNTGLGHSRNERVTDDILLDYQRRIVMGHQHGVGAAMPDPAVRAIMFVRVAGMAWGGSGVHLDGLRTLVRMLNAGVHPLVPEVGSVGASDLAHLGAVGMVVIGGGWARYRGQMLPGAEALAAAGIEPYEMRPKDALAFISANATSIGLGALGVVEAERLCILADQVAALTLEALQANLSPFDEEVVARKPIPGQIDSAAAIRRLVAGGDLERLDQPANVQDALSLRTIPQVHGALREQVAFTRRAVELELNSIGDNPYVSIERDTTISNGNFHPMVLALAFDSLPIGIAHVGMLSERRVQKLLAARSSLTDSFGLLKTTVGPRRLPGMLSYATAALVSELKHATAPVTIHCPPLDFDIEDHATLAPQAVAASRSSIEKLATMLAIEALFATENLEASGVEVRLGVGTQAVRDRVVEGLAELPASAPAADSVASVRDRLLAFLAQDSR